MPELKRAAIHGVRAVLRRCVPLMRWWPGTSRSEPPMQPVRRILLLHPGHLGDIVISTSILAPLEQAFPGAAIDFVVGSWSATALQGLEIQHVHRIDHWRLNRTPISLPAKWARYWTSRRAALRSIRTVGYDVAICLLDENPDLLDVAWSAGIPVRVGWASSFFAPLSTRQVTRSPQSLSHQAVRQAQTLTAFGIAPTDPALLRSRVAPDTPDSLAEVAAALGVPSLHSAPFCVLHAGAGAAMKQMPTGFWRHIAATLCTQHTLLFTGRGEEERQAAAEIMQGLPNCINACDQLSWNGFVSALRAAERLYCVDSMAGHVAAAVGTPVIAAYQGAGGVSRWRPLTPLATVFTQHLPCAPCLLPNGCVAMPCKQIDPDSLLTASLTDPCFPVESTPHLQALHFAQAGSE